MHKYFQIEVSRLVVVLLVASLFASVTSEWSFCLISGLVALVVWHLSQIFVLERYLHGGSEVPIERLSGVWRYVATYADRILRQSKKRKKRLTRLLKRFHKTLEAMPDAIVVLDDKQCVEWANTSAKKMLDVSVQNVGRSIAALLADEEFINYLESADYSQRLVTELSGNRHLSLEIQITPFGRGQLLLVARDVTETAQLQRVRRDFVANVSHELRTPLTVIMGYLEMLQQEDFAPAVTDALRATDRQAVRMRGIVHDLLLLSRLEMADGKPEDDYSPINVDGVLSNLLLDAQQLSGEKAHKFNLDIKADFGLLGSEQELTSAFGNLIFNAVRHTAAGTSITVSWQKTTDGAAFIVADKGQGIDGQHLRRLSERFYRVDTGRSRESGGTGLGLSIVKHVMRAHGGVLDIESELGKGSRFICNFPSSALVASAEF